jgi:hypothetical protein
MMSRWQVAPPEVYQTCLMKECGESNFRSCPGRGAAPFALLRRAGTYLDAARWTPAQQRTAARCVRGTPWHRRRFSANSRLGHLPLTNCTQPSSCDCMSVFLSSSNSATRFAAAVIALAATL